MPKVCFISTYIAFHVTIWQCHHFIFNCFLLPILKIDALNAEKIESYCLYKSCKRIGNKWKIYISWEIKVYLKCISMDFSKLKQQKNGIKNGSNQIDNIIKTINLLILFSAFLFWMILTTNKHQVAMHTRLYLFQYMIYMWTYISIYTLIVGCLIFEFLFWKRWDLYLTSSRVWKTFWLNTSNPS